MRINYNNYPILEKIKNGSLGRLPIYEGDYLALSKTTVFQDEFKANSKKFNSNINVISSPFSQAADKVKKKLGELYKKIIYEEDITISGTYVFGEFVHCIDYVTHKDSERFSFTYFLFSKAGMILAFEQQYIEENKTGILWVSSVFGIDKKDFRKWIIDYQSSVILFELFKRYASVETKFLPPSTKIKDSSGKYLNETKSDITFLDSKWFTTLVKSDGFLVSGHFRLQPKKVDGVWTRELIWIDEFQKSGYTSKARILSGDNL